jgi:hypothetical protein
MPCRHPFWITPFIDLGAGPVESIKRSRRHVAVELRAVCGDVRLKIIEDLLGQTARIRVGLDHDGRSSA